MAVGRNGRVWPFIVAILGVTVTVMTLAVPHTVDFSPSVNVPWWTIAAAFAVTETFVIHLHLRRDSHSLSLSEIPLIVGLAFLSPLHVLGARIVGGGLTLLLVRRQAPTKLAFNLALHSMETAVAAWIFRGFLAGEEPIHVKAWLAAGLAILVIDLLGTLCITIVIWLHEGTVHLAMLKEVATIGVFLALCNTAVAALVVTVTWDYTEALIPLALVTGFLYLGYRGYVQLRQRYMNLQMLLRFTSATARSGETRASAAGMLAEVAELLRCDIAELLLIDQDGRQAMRVRLAYGEILREDDIVTTEAGLAWCTAQQGSTGQRIHHPAEDEGLASLFPGVVVRDALFAPIQLQAAENLRGLVLAVNRSDAISTFDDEDLELFTSLAGHASIALENGRLVERLRAEAEEKAHQALHDALTGLPNRLALKQRLDDSLQTASVESATAILLMDLDGFKEVNDTLGHHVGDRLLVEVANRLLAVVRPHDTVARLGGDEFAMVLPDIGSADQAEAVAIAIDQALRAPCQVGEITLDLRGSIGIALSPRDGVDAQALLQRADVAMYRAKAGGGGFSLYHSDNDHHSHRRLALAAELRSTVEQWSMDVHYQPKVDLQTGQPLGVEALARWHHESLGTITPDEFIPVAEQSGLIRSLTVRVIAEALSDLRRWRAAGLDISVAVNLSARTVVDLDFPADLSQMLIEHETPRGGLVLEITETSILTDRDRAVTVMNELAAMGVGLSIDDFGTGYSSLAHLRRMPVDEIKVDRSFVRSMLTDSNDEVIARSIIELGHNLGLRVVAEGVEDEATAAALRAVGCDAGQGFLWSAALPPDIAFRWLREQQDAKDTQLLHG